MVGYRKIFYRRRQKLNEVDIIMARIKKKLENYVPTEQRADFIGWPGVSKIWTIVEHEL